MSRPELFALDLAAIAILTFGLYFPRHRRRDILVAYLGVNVGVLGVAQALASAGVGAGLGLGLFGVLSIIRLRSAEMDQQEVAYYFGALTLGLLGGIPVSPGWFSAALMGAIVAAFFLGDSPRLFSGYRTQVITLDAAYTDEGALKARLEQMLQAKVHRVGVRRVDLVNDTTSVEVRFESRPASGGDAPTCSGQLPKATWR